MLKNSSTILLFFFLYVSQSLAYVADDPWIIRSPLPEQTISDGEVFILVELESGNPPDPASIDILVDGVDYTSRAKISASSISLLYSKSLAPGRHEIQLRGRTLDGDDLQNIVWYFFVPGEDPGAIADASPASSTKSRAPLLEGRTYIDTRNSDISGNRNLRQEPARSYSVRADLEGSYGAFRFPVKLYVSTDETSSAQPRNRFLAGAESKHLTVLVGDTTPRYNSLILSGARVRGGHVSTGMTGIRLTANYGLLQRGVQGASVSDAFGVDPLAGLSGSYQRTLASMKLDFGSPKSVLFSLSALKAKDDTSSVNIGLEPLENLVAGSDFKVNLLKSRLKFETGAAISITTEDISRGASSKAEIDSLFDTNIPIDPSDFSWLITLNPTTIPLRLDKLSSLAWFAGTKASSYGHLLSIEYRSIGSTFFSAGNPYLQANRNSLTISDRFRHLRGAVSGLVRYQHYATPKESLVTGLALRSDMFSTQLNVAPNREWPRMTAGYRLQIRKRDGTDPQVLTTNSRLTTVSLGALYQLKTGTITHGINVFGSRSLRRDETNPGTDNSSYALTASVSEQLPWPVVLNLNTTFVRVSYEQLATDQQWVTFGGTFGYRWAQPALRVTTDLKYTRSAASTFSAATGRYGFSVRGRYELERNQSIELQAGVDTFRHDEDVTLRYTERFVTLRHRYTF